MKQFSIADVHEVGPKMCEALGLEADQVKRIIIDMDATCPIVQVFVELIGDKIGIDAVMSVLLPFVCDEE